MSSPKQLARIAGVFYLLVGIFGGLAEGCRDGLELGGVGGAGGGQGISPGRAGRAILTDARRRAGTIDPWTRSPR